MITQHFRRFVIWKKNELQKAREFSGLLLSGRPDAWHQNKPFCPAAAPRHSSAKFQKKPQFLSHKQLPMHIMLRDLLTQKCAQKNRNWFWIAQSM
jgi:hypothetical protein